MKYKVNSDCIGCGLCEGICPEVFSMNEEGFAEAIESDVPPSVLSDAADAKDSCPVGAIEEVQ